MRVLFTRPTSLSPPPRGFLPRRWLGGWVGEHHYPSSIFKEILREGLSKSEREADVFARKEEWRPRVRQRNFFNLRCPFEKKSKTKTVWVTFHWDRSPLCALACFALRTGGPARAQESAFPLCYIFNKAKHAENHFPPNYHISSHNGPSSRAAVTPLILHIPLHALSETYCILMQVRWLTFSSAGASLIVRSVVTVEGFECLGFTERSGSVHQPGLSSHVCRHAFVKRLHKAAWIFPMDAFFEREKMINWKVLNNTLKS